MNKLRGSVIGLGKMGLSHAAIIGAHPSAHLVSVCDTSSMIIEAFKRYTKVNTYSDYQKMIDKEMLDFVIVATPTKHHFPMVKYALAHNVNVFCEKPFCLVSSEGNELVNLAKQESLVNQVGYHNHFIGTFRELKRLLSEDIIGEIVHFTGEAYGPVVTKSKVSTWRSKPEEGGGCLYDYASHVINLIQEVIGRPVKIKGAILKSIYSKGVEDAVYSLMILDNKLSGVLLVNWSEETYRKMATSITVQGRKGKIICDATELKIYLQEENKKEKLEKGWTLKYITDFALPVNYHLRGEEYSGQLDYFIDNILRKEIGVYNTFEQGLYTDKVIEMIIENSIQN
jgi:predicted dehydrogenase